MGPSASASSPHLFPPASPSPRPAPSSPGAASLAESPTHPKHRRVPSFDHVISKLKPMVSRLPSIHSSSSPFSAHVAIPAGSGVAGTSTGKIDKSTYVNWAGLSTLIHHNDGTGEVGGLRDEAISPLRSTFLVAHSTKNGRAEHASRQQQQKQLIHLEKMTDPNDPSEIIFKITSTSSSAQPSAHKCPAPSATLPMPPAAGAAGAASPVAAEEKSFKTSRIVTALLPASLLLKPAMQSCLKNSYRFSLPFTPSVYPTESLVFPADANNFEDSVESQASIAQYATEVEQEEASRRASDPDVQSDFERELFKWVDAELKMAEEAVKAMAADSEPYLAAAAAQGQDMALGQEEEVYAPDDDGGYYADLDNSPCLGFEQYKKGGSIHSHQLRKAQEAKRKAARAALLSLRTASSQHQQEQKQLEKEPVIVEGPSLLAVPKTPRFCLDTEIVPRVGSPSVEQQEPQPRPQEPRGPPRRKASIIVLPGQEGPIADQTDHPHTGTAAVNPHAHRARTRARSINVGPPTPFNWTLHQEQQRQNGHDLRTRAEVFCDPTLEQQGGARLVQRIRSRSAPELEAMLDAVGSMSLQSEPAAASAELKPDLATRRMSRLQQRRPPSLKLRDLPDAKEWATVEIEVNGMRLTDRDMSMPAVYDPRVEEPSQGTQEQAKEAGASHDRPEHLQIPERHARLVRKKPAPETTTPPLRRLSHPSDQVDMPGIGLGIGNMNTLSPIRGMNAPEYSVVSMLASSEAPSSSQYPSQPTRLPRYSLDETLQRERTKAGTHAHIVARDVPSNFAADAFGSLRSSTSGSADASRVDSAAEKAVSVVPLPVIRAAEFHAMAAWAIKTFAETDGGVGAADILPSPSSLADIDFEGPERSASHGVTPGFTVDGILLDSRQMSEEILAASAHVASSPNLFRPAVLRPATPAIFPGPTFADVSLSSGAITCESEAEISFEGCARVPITQRQRRSANFGKRESVAARQVAEKHSNDRKRASAKAAARRQAAKGIFDSEGSTTDDAERSEGSKMQARKDTLAQLTGETTTSAFPADDFFLKSNLAVAASGVERSPSSQSLGHAKMDQLRGRLPRRPNSRGGHDLAAQVAIKEMQKKSPLAPFLARMESCSSMSSSPMVRENSANSVGSWGSPVPTGKAAQSTTFLERSPSVASSSPMIRENSINSVGSFQPVAATRPPLLMHTGPRVATTAAESDSESSSDSEGSSESAERKKAHWQEDTKYHNSRARLAAAALATSLSSGRDMLDLTLQANESPLLISPDSPMDRFTASLRSDPSFAAQLMSSTLQSHDGESDLPYSSKQTKNISSRVQTPLDFFRCVG